jgi:hypothetical protein
MLQSMVIDYCIMFATILLAIVAESRVALGVNAVGQLDIHRCNLHTTT